MNYHDAVSYILNIPKFTKKNEQSHTHIFLECLGNPQKKCKVIHVAGTNGKGSVCVYLDALLRAERKTSGLFVSPHLVKINERIVINGTEVTDEEFLECFKEAMQAVHKMEARGIAHPTFFEMLFGMAVTAFARAGVEYAVLETGLGGRLDATNAVDSPIATVITSIGYDHTEILGNTLTKIAGEKAGIIKGGIPVFYMEGESQSNRVIEEAACKCGAPCRIISNSAYEILGIRDKYIAFLCANAYYEDTTWLLHNIGVYQPGNALAALEVMRYLFGPGGHLEAWRQALKGITWSGRMEEVLPHFYVDGAHNISAIEAFIKSVPETEAGNIILFSAVQDKEYETMIACLCRNVRADFFLVTEIEDKRAVSAKVLGEIFKKYTDMPVIVRKSAEEALEEALSMQGERTVYCLGSLYLAGMIKALV